MLPFMLRANCVAPAMGMCALLWLASGTAASLDKDIPAPRLSVGDHWQYRVTDNLRRGATSQLDVEVIEVTGRTARIQFKQTDASSHREWIDEVDGEGGLRTGSLNREPSRAFDPPAQLLAFPLYQGKTWRQTIDTLRKDTGLKGQILIYGKAGRPAAMTVPAGRFDAVYVHRIVQLDDDEFWRTRTTRHDSIWYVPAEKAPVRETREAQYTARDRGTGPVRTESTVLELVSFRNAAK